MASVVISILIDSIANYILILRNMLEITGKVVIYAQHRIDLIA
jgi:hypothetical protein